MFFAFVNPRLGLDNYYIIADRYHVTSFDIKQNYLWRILKADENFSVRSRSASHEARFPKGYSKMDHVLAGNLSSKSMKAKSIQVKIGKQLELVKFTPETIVKNVPDMKALKGTPAMRVHYKAVGEDKVATKIVVKPKIKVPKEQLIQVDELAELVAKGPEKGAYTLVDSRPASGYEKGYIPTAISVPFNKMEEMKDQLPKDKNRRVIFYCQGYR